MLIELSLFIISIPIAILLEGVKRKLFARYQGRKGPPVVQPFYDLAKLFTKERVEAHESKNLIFYSAPLIALGVIIFNYLIFFGLIKFDYDFIVFTYLFTTAGIILVIGSLASKSPLSFIGSIREILYLIGYEIAFIFILITFISKSGVIVLSDYSSLGFFLAPVSSALLVFIGLPILKITPYDSPIASAEISSSITTEYSGKLLMMYELSDFLKNALFYYTIAFMLFGKSIIALLIIPLLMIFYSLMNATTPRYSFIRGAGDLIFIALLAVIGGVFLV